MMDQCTQPVMEQCTRLYDGIVQLFYAAAVYSVFLWSSVLTSMMDQYTPPMMDQFTHLYECTYLFLCTHPDDGTLYSPLQFKSILTPVVEALWYTISSRHRVVAAAEPGAAFTGHIILGSTGFTFIIRHQTTSLHLDFSCCLLLK